MNNITNLIMDYKLCKDLKNAGFPQPFGTTKWPAFYDEYGVLGNVTYNFNGLNLDKAVYCPTLSELIEACGDTLINLMRHEEKRWTVNGKLGLKNIFGHGSTPEEAVARLYLLINKK